VSEAHSVEPPDPALQMAQHLGALPLPGEVGESVPPMVAQIARLQRRQVVELEQVQRFHEWLETKRLTRQACRVVGESRTGKTVACDAYRLRHRPIQRPGQPPTVPVIYLHPPEDCGPSQLFAAVLEYLKYQMGRGTVSQMREWTWRVLRACAVEMIIIDEAQRLRPKTFSDVRDVFDRLEIAVVLVGTDRLDAVIKRDEQVYNRFLSCHRFERLTPAQIAEVSAIWEARVLKLPKASRLDGASMQKVLVPATRGYIGLLDAILRESGIRALRRGGEHIDIATLTQVVSELV
jgi:DNA transposition AAA+ family ATPase